MQINDFPRYTISDEAFSAILKSDAGEVLRKINANDPALSLKGFSERCLNSIERNGIKFTSDIYGVPTGFLVTLKITYQAYQQPAV